MVSKAAGNRWQVTIKSATVDAEWEATVKKAASRSGLSFADFIVHHSREAAQSVLKNQPVPSAGVPIRLEDLADRVAATSEQVTALAAEQAARDAEQAARHAELRQEIARQARRGRWRR
jgi:hypothetical protein